MVWGQNQSQQNYVGQMGMGNMNMQGMGSLGMGAGGRGILGEPPVSGISGLNNMQGMMGSSGGSDNIDTMIQQRRLQQQLSLRESQLALASNLLQKQNQLIMDVGMPGSIGPMLPSPSGMSRSMIPSLLDMPPRHNKRSVPSMSRDLDVKRRRRDSSSPSDHQRGRNRSSDFDRRRDLDRYSPSRRREEHTSRRDRPSRFSRRDSDELPRRRSRNELEEYDPAKPTDDEMPGLELADSYRIDDRAQRPPVGEKSPFYCHVCDMECCNDQNFRDHMSSTRHKDRISDVLSASSKKSSHVEARLKAQEHLKRIESTRVGFCKVCDQELGIPFLRHKLTTLHKKREMQVRKGCGWCGVKNFLNFSEVLKHRERPTHKENAAKYGKKPETSLDSRRTDGRTDRSSNLVTVDSVGYSPNGENRRSRPRPAVRPGYSSRSSGRSETSRSGTSRPSVKSETKEVDLCPDLQFEADTAVGQNYVIPVSGFFCKLCHKFYNTETAAKVTHCQSQAHFSMFKKAKNAAKARALAQKKASTPGSAEDETKPRKEEADSAEAEQEGEEKKTDNEGLEETENQNGGDAKGPDESEEGQGETEEGQEETEEGQGETEEVQSETELGQGQASEAAEEFDQDEEANEGMKAEADLPEEDEKHLTEEEQEEKLLEKDDNESDTGEVIGDIFADEDEDDTAIIDLADGSSETTGEEKETELSVQESGEAAEQVDENVEAPATDTSPVVRGKGRGRGRGVGRRARRGRK